MNRSTQLASSSRPNLIPRSLNRRPRLHVKAAASLQQRISKTFSDTFLSATDTDSDLSWKQNFNEVYTKGKLLGAGSFGQVHVAVHNKSGEEMAVKTLPKIRGKLSKEKTLEKICREIDMLHRVQSCKGIITLQDCFEDDTSVQIVTELCASGDLQKHVEAFGPLQEKALAMVTFEILKIVKACHDAGIVHGDVKPANFCLHDKRILMPHPHYNGEVSYLKAIDFGCSQFYGSRKLTKRTGTPIFMSPEIFARSYSEQADMWSVGISLYWLFCQRFPFFNNSEVVKASRLEDLQNAITNMPVVYDFGPWPEMSKEGMDFISRCLTQPEDARMTVDQAIVHPWVLKHVSEPEIESALNGSSPAA